MKKLSLILMMMVLSLSLVPSISIASEKDPITKTSENKEVPVEVKVMLSRLEEIKNWIGFQ